LGLRREAMLMDLKQRIRDVGHHGNFEEEFGKVEKAAQQDNSYGQDFVVKTSEIRLTIEWPT